MVDAPAGTSFRTIPPADLIAYSPSIFCAKKIAKSENPTNILAITNTAMMKPVAIQ